MASYEFPTSFAQRQMWLLAEMDSGEPTYNITWALWLDGELEVSALQHPFRRRAPARWVAREPS